MRHTYQVYLDISFGLGYWIPSGRLCRRTIRLLGNPAACRGHKTDGFSPRGVAVHYSTGGRSGSSYPWSTMGSTSVGDII